MLLYGMNEDHSNFDLSRTDLVAVLTVVVLVFLRELNQQVIFRVESGGQPVAAGQQVGCQVYPGKYIF